MVFEGPGPVQAARTKVIDRVKVTEDMLPHPLPGMDHQMLNVGLHVNPQEVMYVLQRKSQIAHSTAPPP
jgi:hypothetical protein